MRFPPGTSRRGDDHENRLLNIAANQPEGVCVLESLRSCERLQPERSTMSVYERRGKWFCDITIDGRRVQRVLKKAHTRAQAIKATTVIENKVFENRYQIERRPEIRFDKFVKDHFLPYSKLHKRTYPDDVKICDMLKETFGRKIGRAHV